MRKKSSFLRSDIRKLIACAVLLLMLTLNACKKDTPPPTPPIDVNVFNQSDFPLKKGNAWTYQRYDSLSRKLDTVVWAIGETVVISGKTMLQWVQTANTSIDTGYIGISGDTIRFYSYPGILQLRDVFIFPMRKDSTWTITPANLGPDVYTPLGARDIIVNGVNYINTFQFSRLETGFSIGVIEDVNISRGIGIAYYHYYKYEMGGRSIYTLSLISYSIK